METLLTPPPKQRRQCPAGSPPREKNGTTVNERYQVSAWIQNQGVELCACLDFGFFTKAGCVEQRIQIVQVGSPNSYVHRCRHPVELDEPVKANLRGLRNDSVQLTLLTFTNGTINSSTEMPPCTTTWSPCGMTAVRPPAKTVKKFPGSPTTSMR